MFCEQCGNQMTEDSLFCSNCGSKNNLQVTEQVSQDSIGEQKQEEVKYTQPEQEPKQNTEIRRVNQPAYVDLNAPMSIGSYLIALLLLTIPIVNIILLIVWAVGSNVNKNKKNFAIAALIFMAISIVIGIVFGAGIALFISNIFDSVSYY